MAIPGYPIPGVWSPFPRWDRIGLHSLSTQRRQVRDLPRSTMPEMGAICCNVRSRLQPCLAGKKDIVQLSQSSVPARQLSGMRGFLLFWFGQFISLLGTQMTRFALTIWAWEITGQATALALVGFFSFAPVVLVSPLAGALVEWKDIETGYLVQTQTAKDGIARLDPVWAGQYTLAVQAGEEELRVPEIELSDEAQAEGRRFHYRAQMGGAPEPPRRYFLPWLPIADSGPVMIFVDP